MLSSENSISVNFNVQIAKLHTANSIKVDINNSQMANVQYAWA